MLDLVRDSRLGYLERGLFQFILGDPAGALSRAGRKGATKVFKHGRKSPWVPTLTGPFPNGQANAGSWLGTKNALYYCAQSANSFSWVLFVSSYTTAIISPQLAPWFSCYYFRCRLTYQKQCDALKYHTSTISSCMVYSLQSLKKRRDCSFKPSKVISRPAASRMLQCWNWYYSPI